MAKKTATKKKPTPSRAEKPAKPAAKVKAKAGAKAEKADPKPVKAAPAKPTKVGKPVGKSAAKASEPVSKGKAKGVKAEEAPRADKAVKVKADGKAKPEPKAEAKAAPKVEAKGPAKGGAKPAGKVVGKAPGKAPVKPEPSELDLDEEAMDLGSVEIKSEKAGKVVEAKAGEVALGADGKPLRKGITIVSPKPVKRAKPPASPTVVPPGLGRLLDPSGPARKPLIPSGPKAAPTRPLGQHGGVGNAEVAMEPVKSPFNKKELEKFRAILLVKRAELVGDVSTMESEALRGDAGGLVGVPSHLAEQGSEAYDQSLSLDLAAADRKLIREIDDALKRIDEGTYGACELTGKPISRERLEELPWARYSIEAARERERQAMRPA